MAENLASTNDASETFLSRKLSLGDGLAGGNSACSRCYRLVESVISFALLIICAIYMLVYFFSSAKEHNIVEKKKKKLGRCLNPVL